MGNTLKRFISFIKAESIKLSSFTGFGVTILMKFFYSSLSPVWKLSKWYHQKLLCKSLFFELSIVWSPWNSPFLVNWHSLYQQQMSKTLVASSRDNHQSKTKTVEDRDLIAIVNLLLKFSSVKELMRVRHKNL